MFEVDYVVVFRNLPYRQTWLWRLLKPGFQHVELWREIVPGAWLRFDTAIEFLSVEVFGDPPWELIEEPKTATYVRFIGAIPAGWIRQPFRVGPVTCVELAAAFLGLRLPFFVRTPHQFYNFLKRQHGPQISKATA